jgi:hypothetical protein
MYYLTSLDVLEYLIKKNSEKFLLEKYLPDFGENTEKNININFLKKHLFYDIEFLLKGIINNTSKNINLYIKIIENKVYMIIDLKIVYEYFKNIFQCDNWISLDYLNFKKEYKYINYPILKIDIEFNTDFKDIITKALHVSICKLLNIDNSFTINNSKEQYIFINYEKLYEIYTNENDFIKSNENEIKFNNEFKNIFLLF